MTGVKEWNGGPGWSPVRNELGLQRGFGYCLKGWTRITPPANKFSGENSDGAPYPE